MVWGRIILNGVNYYPHDIEEGVKDCHPCIRAGGIVAYPTLIGDTEHLGLMIEIRPPQGSKASQKLAKSLVIPASVRWAGTIFGYTQVCLIQSSPAPCPSLSFLPSL